MTITVAVCAYNEENIIDSCIKSIQRQSVKPDEIILLDDHSKDSTAQIGKELGVKVITNEGKQLFDARNTVLKNCKTEILAFTDADCVLDEHWVRNILQVFQTKDVAGGTGSHPPQPSNVIVGWIYKNWLIVGSSKTGYYGGVAGGNCYFKTDALRKVGGWLSLPYSNAEDVYIGEALIRNGYKLWYDENIIAYHNFNCDLLGFFKKIIKAGEAITVTIKVADKIINPGLQLFTFSIPVVAISTLITIGLIFVMPKIALLILTVIFTGSFIFVWRKFGSFRSALPRFLSRWIIIWPYSFGIIKGLFYK